MILRKTTYVSALSVRGILAKLSLALVWQIALASRSSAIEFVFIFLSFVAHRILLVRVPIVGSPY